MAFVNYDRAISPSQANERACRGLPSTPVYPDVRLHLSYFGPTGTAS